MTRFGKHVDWSLGQMAGQALDAALADASLSAGNVEAAYVANAGAGGIWGQECIRGQVMLAQSGLPDLPVFNIENACASGSTALHLAWLAVASGQYDVVVALGAEKMHHPDKHRVFNMLRGGTDVDSLPAEATADNSIFMEYYAQEAKEHMRLYGTSIETLGQIAVKNSLNGSLNRYAQYQSAQTLESVLGSRMIADPLRLLMCSPVSDGAAAVVLASERFVARSPCRPVLIRSSVVLSSQDRSENRRALAEKAGQLAYARAGVGPADLNVVEVHDAAAPGELWAYEQLGLCGPGEGAALVLSGATRLDGRIPVNPSGGLIARGHPLGATGVAQIIELVWQLRQEAGERQISGKPKVGLAHNAGGFLDGDNAVVSCHILVT